MILWGGGLVGLLALPDPCRQYPWFLSLAAPSVGGWCWLTHLARRGALSQRVLLLAVGIALAARAVALTMDPAFSLDAFRYVFEGRVVWSMGIGYPFAHAPAEALAQGVPQHLMDRYWVGINHPEIPTIYPPLSQLVFAAAGGLSEALGTGHLFLLKLALVLCEIAAVACLVGPLKRRNGHAAEAWALLLCPVLILEVAREGHADALSLLGLAIGAAGFVELRPRAGYVGWGLAALAKLNGAVLFPLAIRSTRRGLGLGLLLLLLLGLPALFAGGSATTGMHQYATRWQSGDGLFSLVLWSSEWLLGGDWRRIGAWTITQHQLARGLTAVLFAGIYLAALARPSSPSELPARGGLLLLLLLLLAPTLHPWYTLWLLPLTPFMGIGRRSAIVLIASCWLAHHAGWLELVHGSWTDLGWVRALIHIPPWTLLFWDAARMDPERRFK